MSNSKKKTPSIFLACITCALFLMSCKLFQHSTDHYQPMVVKYNVEKRVTELTDSLRSISIDTFFVFSKECHNCYFTPFIPSKKDIKKQVRYTSQHYTQPAYIFWVQKGHYFIRKVDEFYDYSSIERSKNTQLPLYDYLVENRAFFAEESYIFERYDTLFSPTINTIDFDTIIETTPVVYYIPESQSVDYRNPYSNALSVHYSISGIEDEHRIETAYFEPIAPPSFEANYMDEHQLDAIFIGNNNENYRINHGMKLYQWTTLIESELLDTETQKLWNPK